MTTYYLYNKDGTVTSSHMNPNARVFAAGFEGTASHEQHEDIVGAYLAHREACYPALAGQGVYLDQNLPHQQEGQSFDSSAVSDPTQRSHWSGDEHGSSGYPDSSRADSESTLGYAGWTSLSNIAHPYPDPETIRHMHTLHSLLPCLQPERKLNALKEQKIDIVEQDTGVVFGYQVPKKMLVLFLGRKVIEKYIRTMPTHQEMRLPRGKSSKSAIRILIAWMIRACQLSTMSTMKPIHVPEKTFVACSLAQTMELFGLHKDALRVDHTIVSNHFVRPIFAGELESLWNCLGGESRYVYAAIKVVGKRIQEHEGHDSKVIRGVDEDMYALMKKHPRLEARLRDLGLNEQYKPSFSTDWTKRLVESEHDDNASQSQDTNEDHALNETEDATHKLGALRIISSDESKPSPGAEADSDVSEADGGSRLYDGSKGPQS
ncbi:hypothetical protein yc1106_07845 [Curvularia clavata]|uniref:Uncharacterized protein n=1 Tax=Curvularia clavata TaxID=95742 RepID=A0A9Q9DWK3_CURCL|nr:hypothetical protein yc1106_07845 [Curvularia clavata]